MPIVSTFFGIIIRIFHSDHNPPHFHAYYSESEAIIEITSGKILAGSLPARAKKLVDEWRKIHKEELLKCWTQAQNLKTLKKIKPLE